MWPSQINVWAVFLAAGAFFVLGAVWYGALAKPWMRLAKKTPADVEQGNTVGPYLTAAVGAVMCAATLAYFIDVAQAETLPQYMLIAALLWGGVAAATSGKHYAFVGLPAGLFVIDLSYDLVGFLVMSGILWLWR